ncbi:MAG: hypothetical protein RXR65_00035 [Hydrogenobaculum sp.]
MKFYKYLTGDFVMRHKTIEKSLQEAMKYFGFNISKVQTESDSIAFYFVGLRKNRHIRCKKCYAHYNGSEFMEEFDKYLKEIGIEHYYSYPRTPETYKYATVYGNGIKNSEVVDRGILVL